MAAKATTPTSTDDVLRELRAFGLAYPGAHTKSPWPGHLDLAVKDKTFAYLSLEGEPLRVSCKLPHSADVALMLPFVQPAAYGLGKSGWVAADFSAHAPDVDMLKAWIDESYRAQAPKKLVAALAALPAPTSGPRASGLGLRPGTRKPAAKAAAKRATKDASKPATPTPRGTKPATAKPRKPRRT